MGTCSCTQRDLLFYRSLPKILDIVDSLYRMPSSPVEHCRKTGLSYKNALQESSVGLQSTYTLSKDVNPFNQYFHTQVTQGDSTRCTTLRMTARAKADKQSCAQCPPGFAQPWSAPQLGHKHNSFFPTTSKSPQHPPSPSSHSTRQENTHTAKTQLPPRSQPKPCDHLNPQVHDKHFASEQKHTCTYTLLQYLAPCLQRQSGT